VLAACSGVTTSQTALGGEDVLRTHTCKYVCSTGGLLQSAAAQQHGNIVRQNRAPACSAFRRLPGRRYQPLAQLRALHESSCCCYCRFFVELEVGCFHMTCRCGYGFCYVCTAQWKTCRCRQWDEGRLVLQARQQVDVQVCSYMRHTIP
jgi:hypothetical protein